MADLNKLLKDGEFKPVGLATLSPDQDLSYIYRGSWQVVLPDGQTVAHNLTLVTEPDGEWITLIRSGQGLDLKIEQFFRFRFDSSHPAFPP